MNGTGYRVLPESQKVEFEAIKGSKGFEANSIIILYSYIISILLLHLPGI